LSAINEAASVLLARGAGSHEVFLVARSPELRFMGGFHVFPGGKVHADDVRAGASVRQVAAVRELFEEAGVLLARRADGSFPPGNAHLADLRRRLLADEVSFRDLLAGLGLHVRADDLTPAGNLVTPAFAPVRFDTSFFVATLPPGQQAEVWPGELSGGAWQSADEALRDWDRGAYLLSPPTVALLQAIRGRPVADLPERVRPMMVALEAGALHEVWFSPGVRMIPLHCDGLPMVTTYTNAYLVGTGPTYLLDPGPTNPEEQRRLFDVLDPRPPDAVVLTHHHPDHIGAANACARRYGVPILAHPRTARALAGKVEVTRTLEDGERLDLGVAPHGHGRWHVEALLTPGHAPGHLAFYEPSYRLLFAGDMVSTLTSIVIVPPEGDLAVYVASLQRLKEYPARLLLPAHGSASARPGFVLDEALTHRARREEQLAAALGREPRRVADLVAELYRGVPANLLRLAELQTLAGLYKLRNEGRAEPAGDGWRAAGR
jgi:glyoxylase-like metal-dependent hydrolase (beta-lactamase superfamily II)/8-oxo-dGTP pyrophosphatase MutT (NUDIX family)